MTFYCRPQNYQVCNGTVLCHSQYSVAFIPPNLELKSGATFPHFWVKVSPISDLSFPLHFRLFSRQAESFVKGVVCPVKNRWEVLIYNLINTTSLFFAGRKLHPPGVGIEATGNTHSIAKLAGQVCFIVIVQHQTYYL